MSEKITTHHLERRALIYVRQSSYQQLLQNLEGQRLQYCKTSPQLVLRG